MNVSPALPSPGYCGRAGLFVMSVSEVVAVAAAAWPSLRLASSDLSSNVAMGMLIIQSGILPFKIVCMILAGDRGWFFGGAGSAKNSHLKTIKELEKMKVHLVARQPGQNYCN